MSSWDTDSATGALYARFSFKNFSEAFSFVSRISEVAEEANHHPDITFGWGYVEVRLYTHDAQAVTEKDFQLSRKIDTLAQS